MVQVNELTEREATLFNEIADTVHAAGAELTTAEVCRALQSFGGDKGNALHSSKIGKNEGFPYLGTGAGAGESDEAREESRAGGGKHGKIRGVKNE